MSASVSRSLKRSLLAYLVGWAVLSAGLSVTCSWTMGSMTDPLMTAARESQTTESLKRLHSVWILRTVVVNTIPFLLAGIAVGVVVGSRRIAHGAAFGACFVAFGAVLPLVVGVFSLNGKEMSIRLLLVATSFAGTLAGAALSHALSSATSGILRRSPMPTQPKSKIPASPDALGIAQESMITTEREDCVHERG